MSQEDNSQEITTIESSKTTYDTYFKALKEPYSIKEKIKYLCLQEENNFFYRQASCLIRNNRCPHPPT